MTTELHIERAWCIPSRWTFSMAPVAALLDRVLDGRVVVVDPFCGQSHWASVRNDLSLPGGQEAVKWLSSLIDERGHSWADAVLLDPPYSPRQISECYKSIGLSVSSTDTQNALLYSRCIELLTIIAKPGAIGVRCGWNSSGFGKSRGWTMRNALMVCHGAAHNDTIVTVDELTSKQESLI